MNRDDQQNPMVRRNERFVQLYNQGYYEQALEMAVRLREDVDQQRLGISYPHYSVILNNVANLYRDRADYDEAEKLYRQALQIAARAVGEDDPYYATGLNNLAQLYFRLGRYVQAEKWYQQALQILGNVPRVNAVDYAGTLNNLATLYRQTGNYDEAEKLYRQALQIAARAVGEDDPYYATGLNNLGLLYRLKGDYKTAKLLYMESLNIRRRVLREDHPDIAASFNNLARIDYYMNNTQHAIFNQLKALDIEREAWGEGHPYYALGLDNLATCYRDRGDYDEAEKLYRQALQIRHDRFGVEHISYATTLGNLAAVHERKGNYAKAERFRRQSLEAMGKAVTEEHPEYAVSQAKLASLYQDMGRHAEAEPLLRRALETVEKILGEEDPGYIAILSSLASLRAARGHEGEALTLLEKVTTLEDNLIWRGLSMASEAGRDLYLRTFRISFMRFISLVLEQFSDSSRLVKAAMDLVLRRKAIGAEVQATQRDALVEQRYPQLASGLRELRILKAEIAQKTMAGPGSESIEAFRHHLMSQRAIKERIEAELVINVPEMNLEHRLRDVNLQAIAQELPKGSTLVEFVRVWVCDFKAPPAQDGSGWKPERYVAFVLPAGKPDDVRMIDLGEANPIDRMIASFRTSITGEVERSDGRGAEIDPIKTSHVSVRSDRSDIREAIFATRHAGPGSTSEELLDSTRLGSELRRALFEPLLPALSGRTQLFLAPDGDLARLPFEVLPGEDGGHLIDEYEISYLGVGRDALRFTVASAGQPGPPLVVADPDFDLAAADGRDSSAPFQRLGGTRREGERVADALGVTPLLRDGALEKPIKGSRSPYILHLATHGFFLPDAPRDQEDSRPGLAEGWGEGLLAARLGRVEDPLLRSGLALAGANAWLEDGSFTEEAEDGLLTAEDVTGMDLLDTELVVLSACETGLGQVRVGEGVYGLRRAFVLAGAKTLVMSLWKVPDQQTQELMEDFYRRLLQGQPRAEALRGTQLSMKERYPDPLYWGAFICQGDPDPLPRYATNTSIGEGS